MTMNYDLLIKKGLVVDPSQGIHGVRDVALARGRVAAVEEGIPEGQAAQVVDASGLVVTPGLVDLHVHVYPGVSDYGIEADPACLERGVTTAVDAGSAGACTFPGFRKYVVERVETRLLAFLHISAMGVLYHGVQELEDLRWADVAWAVARGREHRDIVCGIKIRLSRGIVGKNSDLDALARALEAAAQLGVPVMAHVGDTPSPMEKIAEMLRAGDIITHSFHGNYHGILDDRNHVLPGILEAVRRGVLLDVGHGAGSFSFDVMDKALSQGLKPSTISSDLHIYNIEGPVYDQATTLSKFLHLGLSLDEVVRLGTEAPAHALGMAGVIGTLKPGAEGDVSLFRLEEGSFKFVDAYGKSAVGRQRLAPALTVRGGRVFRTGQSAWGAPPPRPQMDVRRRGNRG
jgi:dihydroorotase